MKKKYLLEIGLIMIFLLLKINNTVQAEEKPEVFVQLGHHVNSAAYSPDGKFILSGGDKTLILWEVSTGREIRKFQGHSQSIKSVAFSPNGRYALSVCQGNIIKLWDIFKGTNIVRFQRNRNKKREERFDYVNKVLFCPNGRYALSVGVAIRLWDIETGKEIIEFEERSDGINSSGFRSIDVSPDGKYAIVGGNDDTDLRLFDVYTGKRVKVYHEPSEESDERWVGISSVAFSPNGRYVAAGVWYHNNYFCRLWDIRTSTKIKEFKVKHGVGIVAFTPDGRFVLSSSGGESIHMWEVERSDYEQKVFQTHPCQRFLAISPSGQFILEAGCHDKTLKQLNISTGNVVNTFNGYSSKALSAVFSHNFKYILSGVGDKKNNLWDFSAGKKILSFQEDFDVQSIGFYENKVLSGTKKNINIWNSIDVKKIKSFERDFDNITFSGDGRFALLRKSTYPKPSLFLLDLKSNEEKQSVLPTESLSRSSYQKTLALSPNKRYTILEGYERGNYFWALWDIANSKQVRIFQIDTYLQDRDPYRNMPRRAEEWGHAAVFSNDNKYALLSGYSVIRLYNVLTGKEIRTFKGHSSLVLSVCLSTDSKYVLSGSRDRTIRLWDISSGSEIKAFYGHLDSVTSVSFSHDGKNILSASTDDTVRIWNITTGKEIAQMVNFKDDEWITITPEGYYNASVNGDKYLNVRIGNNVYGIDQFREKYYRPDIVRLALKLGDTQKAIAQLKGDTQGLKAKEEPPKVWFTFPTATHETTNPQLNIRVKTEDLGDTAESVTFYVNHRPLATEKRPVRPVSPGAKIREFSRQIHLTIGENWIEAVAKGKQGATQSAIVLVIRKGQKKKLPDLYYLGAGVSRHSIPALSLKYPAKDVTGVAEALKRQKGQVYSEVNIKTITDTQATRGSIIDGIESFFKDAKQEDVAILFVSGHGMNAPSGYHFIAYDTDPDRLSSTGISWQFFDEVLKTVKSSVLLFADTCHSGNIAGNEAWRSRAEVDPNEFLRNSAKSGVIVLSSSSGSTVSREDPAWGHGAFARALIDGLMGEAAYKHNTVKLSFFQDYVSERVMELTDNTQQPIIPKLDGGGAFLNLVLAEKM